MNASRNLGLALLLATLPCFAQSAGVPADKAFDPAAEWQRFLANADAGVVYGQYAVMRDLADDAGVFDAAACREQGKALDAAVAAVPVSLAMQFAAYRCAEAVKDEAKADAALARYSALARHALAQASDDPDAPPIRVVAGNDIYSLLEASGLELRYEYLDLVGSQRYLTLVTASWDPQAKRERHLRFDYLDTVVKLERKSPYAAYPLFRRNTRDQFIKELAAGNRVSGTDVAGIRGAIDATTPQDKVAALRPIAEQGGYQSSLWWLMQCERTPFTGCGAGLVDALLPRAEKREALPLVLLALANARGIGVKKDAAAAMTLLDAAEAQWGNGRAIVAYARYLDDLDSAPFPAALQSRLDRAGAAGNPDPAILALLRRIAASKDETATPEDLRQLTALADRGRRVVADTLANQLYFSDHAADALPWLRRAAEGGDPHKQQIYGASLLYGGKLNLPIDREQGLRWLREAAHGGNTLAMATLSNDAGNHKDWAASELWLASAETYGEDEAAYWLAELYSEGHPGLHGDGKSALEIYRKLSEGKDPARARRAWAEMLIDGKAVPKDLKAAEALLRQDADKGDITSQVVLAHNLLEGRLGRVDEVAGLALLEKAMADPDEGASAVDTLAYWLYYKKATTEARVRAVVLWRSVMAREGVDFARNNLAWVLCTSPDAAIRKPAEGQVFADQLGAPEALNSGTIDTVAACQAANGHFERAVALQGMAVERLEREQPGDDGLGGMRERLTAYRAGKPHLDLAPH